MNVARIPRRKAMFSYASNTLSFTSVKFLSGLQFTLINCYIIVTLSGRALATPLLTHVKHGTMLCGRLIVFFYCVLAASLVHSTVNHVVDVVALQEVAQWVFDWELTFLQACGIPLAQWIVCRQFMNRLFWLRATQVIYFIRHNDIISINLTKWRRDTGYLKFFAFLSDVKNN